MTFKFHFKNESYDVNWHFRSFSPKTKVKNTSGHENHMTCHLVPSLHNTDIVTLFVWHWHHCHYSKHQLQFSQLEFERFWLSKDKQLPLLYLKSSFCLHLSLILDAIRRSDTSIMHWLLSPTLCQSTCDKLTLWNNQCIIDVSLRLIASNKCKQKELF